MYVYCQSSWYPWQWLSSAENSSKPEWSVLDLNQYVQDRSDSHKFQRDLFTPFSTIRFKLNHSIHSLHQGFLSIFDSSLNRQKLCFAPNLALTHLLFYFSRTVSPLSTTKPLLSVDFSTYSIVQFLVIQSIETTSKLFLERKEKKNKSTRNDNRPLLSPRLQRHRIYQSTPHRD